MYNLYCSRCHRYKDVAEFPPSARTKAIGASPGYCKECRREYQQQYRQRHPRDYAHEYTLEEIRLS